MLKFDMEPSAIELIRSNRVAIQANISSADSLCHYNPQNTNRCLLARMIAERRSTQASQRELNFAHALKRREHKTPTALPRAANSKTSCMQVCWGIIISLRPHLFCLWVNAR
jgi:hypothetical protein